jgi:hypothetical protein
MDLEAKNIIVEVIFNYFNFSLEIIALNEFKFSLKVYQKNK